MSGDWLKAQGLGRERLAGHLQSYLEELGFRVESSDRDGSTELRAQLARMNPSIPGGLVELRFRLRPTSGGASLAWEFPTTLASGEAPRAERLGREIEQKLMRVALTESHGTAKLRPASGARWPWAEPAPEGTPGTSTDEPAPAPL
ncbi:MAG TPA: hypothetical protein VGU43_05265 [Thermoplasmata archaeon]|nr:hypothetical protein [Thermoplasmata archaeon]